jgi:hypothetical protein
MKRITVLLIAALLSVGLLTSTAQAHESAAHKIARITIERDPAICPAVKRAINIAGYLRTEQVFARSYPLTHPPAYAVFAEIVAQCARKERR